MQLMLECDTYFFDFFLRERFFLFDTCMLMLSHIHLRHLLQTVACSGTADDVTSNTPDDRCVTYLTPDAELVDVCRMRGKCSRVSHTQPT